MLKLVLIAFLSGACTVGMVAMLAWPTPTRCDVQRPVLQQEPIRAPLVNRVWIPA